MTEILTPVLGQLVATWLTWLSANGGLAVAGPFVIELMKRSARFPWLDAHSDTAARVWSVAFAVASTVGISYAYDQQAGVLTVTGVSPEGLAAFLLEAGARFGGQEAAYRWLIKDRRR